VGVWLAGVLVVISDADCLPRLLRNAPCQQCAPKAPPMRRVQQDACISSGSIFGIYTPGECVIADDDNADQVLEKCVTNVRKAGTELVAAGYCLYSSATILVLTLGNGVYSFTLDRGVGEFVLTERCARFGSGFGTGQGGAGLLWGWVGSA